MPEGLLEARVALIAALVCGAIAVVATAVLIANGSSPLFTFLLLSLAIFLAWNYSGPPLWLNRRGLGEITGAILVPGLTTLLSFQVQGGSLHLLPILALFGLPLPVAIAVLLTAPIAFWQSWRIHRGAATDSTQWNALAFWSIGLLIAAALLEIGAFITAWAN